MNSIAAEALNRLVFHAHQASLSPTGAQARLRALLGERPELLRPSLMFAWLWNLLLVAGLDEGLSWLQKHEKDYMEALKQSSAREAIFLLVNGWWIDETIPKRALTSPGIAAQLRSYLDDSSQELAMWERYGLWSICDICGLQVPIELPSALAAEMQEQITASPHNPAVALLLAYALSKLARMRISDETVDGLIAQQSPLVRDQSKRLLNSAMPR